MENEQRPVEDWATDFDLFDEGYIENPAPVWRDLRQRCPIAHTTRMGGAWMATKYEDLREMVRMVPELSSRSVAVVPPPPDLREELIAEVKLYGSENPPITMDPPGHMPFKRLILPFFTPDAVEAHRAYTEGLCHQLVDAFVGEGTCDAARQYSQQIPPRVIARMLGIDPDRADEFTEWTQGVLEFGQTQPELRRHYRRVIREFFAGLVAERRRKPGDDMISRLAAAEVDGKPLSDYTVIGICNLLLVAGIDTTWSSIGAALWHLAGHDDDRRRLASEPDLFPTAIEEFLRFYGPVMMARKVTEPVTIGDVTMNPGDKLILNFPAGNRDPEIFERPEEVVLDRERNRHIAFGIGIHRCAGSNLARMEMDVALRVFVARVPEFRLSDPDAVTWSAGQVRGPRSIPISFPVR